ncbi:MAG: hypothetical protein HZB38_03115 [Planctomycetes bacterium]|nr:hypothetical protein [Planctomycetota bacterium]
MAANLGEYLARFREARANWRADFRQWRADVRENPALIFRSLGVRLLLWAALGIVMFYVVSRVFINLAPSATEGRLARTRLATLYVACTNPDCLHGATTEQTLDFKAWPLTCEQCGKQTAYRATLCPKCRNWFAAAPGGPSDCPLCKRKSTTQPTSKPARKRSDDPDDREDGWDR